MKVLHLISGGDSGGAKTHVLSLLSDLNKSIQADLVCYMEAGFSEEARQRGIPVTVLSGGFASGLRATKRIIRDGGYELVHCHGSRANLIGCILKRDFDIPFISTVHSDYKLDYLGRPLAQMSYGVLNGIALRRMDYRVCVSDQMLDTLISRRFKPNDMYAIYNGIDFSMPPPKLDRTQWLSSIGCDFAPDDIIVGIAARLDPVKNVSALVSAFAEASRTNPKLKLFIAGEGQEREALGALAEEKGVADKVFFAGWLSPMDGYYSSVDINVICSLSETFPYAVTEAARARIPTVASRVGGLPKLIIPEKTGLLFEPTDIETFAKCLSRLAGDAELRKRLGDAVYEKAHREFSTENTCRRQLEIYASVIRRYKAKRNKLRCGTVICGAYGHGNAGDEAILAEMIRQLHVVSPDMEVTVISKNPKKTKHLHKVNALARSNILGIERLFRRTKLYINGGGSLIQDVTSRRSLYYYLYTIASAKKKGCSVQMYGCGIGPLLYDIDRRHSAHVIDRCVDTVTLRDPDSLRTLKAMGVTKPKTLLSADPVVSVEPADDAQVIKLMKEYGMEPKGSYICLSLRRWRGFAEKAPEIAEALKSINRRFGLIPVFLPMNANEDEGANHLVADLYGEKHIRLDVIKTPELAMGLMSRMKVVAAMRLHTLLYAANCETPLVGISYDPKVTSFIRYTGSGIALQLEELSAEMLEAAVATVYAEPRQQSERLTLKTAERKNIEQAAMLYNA